MTRARTLRSSPCVWLGLAALAAACSADAGSGGDTGALGLGLVVDANRDGDLDLVGRLDEPGKDAFDDSRGAIVLANLDDDDGDGLSDALGPGVAGDADATDLSLVAVRGRADLPDGATGTLAVDAASLPHVRLFRVTGPVAAATSYAPVASAAGVPLTTADLRAGALFALDARAFVGATRDGWGGSVKLTLEAASGATELTRDAARLRVAPVLFQWNTAPTQEVFHTNLGEESAALEAGLSDVCKGARCSRLSIPDYDQWAQDFFDVAYTSRPGPGGTPHGMRVVLRSAQPDRAAGQAMRRKLGPGVAYVEVHHPWSARALEARAETLGYSMDSFGNWDVVPPYEHDGKRFPFGRNVWGRGTDEADADFLPDPTFEAFVEAQSLQPSIHVDTSWLAVGHVDEYFSWVQTNTPRGWGMLAARPSLARSMLQELERAGHGAAPLFDGLYDYADEMAEQPTAPARRTVSQLLADADLMARSQAAEAEIEDAVAIMKRETGLADAEFTPMPFLFTAYGGAAVAYQPGTVNLLHADGRVVAPKPFGPVIDGVDPFEKDLVDRLGALGIEVRFADVWYLYHINMGEVHCGTNVARDVATVWWESGR